MPIRRLGICGIQVRSNNRLQYHIIFYIMSNINIRDIFYSEKNVQMLTKILSDELNIDNTKVAQTACKNIIMIQMELVFKKNNDKILRADSKKILPILNDKVIGVAIKIFSAHMKNKTNHATANTSDGRFDSECTLQNPTDIPVQPIHTKKPSIPKQMYSNMGDTGYAPIVPTSSDRFVPVIKTFWCCIFIIFGYILSKYIYLFCINLCQSNV
jgi:hypothetical protein